MTKDPQMLRGPLSASATGLQHATWEEDNHANYYSRREDVVHLKPSSGGAQLMAREERSMRNFSVGCWNVTTLNYALAPEHLMIALKDYRYDIIALSETHLLGQEEVCKGRCCYQEEGSIMQAWEFSCHHVLKEHFLHHITCRTG